MHPVECYLDRTIQTTDVISNNGGWFVSVNVVSHVHLLQN